MSISLSEIEWGPLDAAALDESFLNKFVKFPKQNDYESSSTSIIPGAKGSGKTALCEWIKVSSKDKYSSIVSLRFDDMDFGAIFANLSELSSVSGVDNFTIISHYWEYVIIVECAKAYFAGKQGKIIKGEESTVYNYLLKNGLVEHGPAFTMLALISKCWSILDEITGKRQSDYKQIAILPSNLTPQIINEISKFPNFDPEFIRANKAFASTILSKKYNILVLLDNFDRLRVTEANQKNYQVIFEGLVQAVYNLSISRDYKGHVGIKCLIPHDRFISLEMRDFDKISSNSVELCWDYLSLKEFVLKRIKQHKCIPTTATFEEAWENLMPACIFNRFNGIEEYSFDFILRHSLYTPRHLQTIMRYIGGATYSKNISESVIHRTLIESTRQIAQFLFAEYRIDFPYLPEFIRNFRGKNNILTYSELKKTVHIGLEKCGFTNENTIDLVNLLYRMNFIGVLQLSDISLYASTGDRYIPPKTKDGIIYMWDFYYSSPTAKISQRVDDDSIFAIHPIFYSFAEISVDPKYIVG